MNILFKATSNIQESSKFIKSLKRYQDFIKRSKSLCLVFTGIVVYKITLHINLHILFMIYIKTSSKIQESSKSIKYIKSYQQNKIEFLEKFYFIYISFEFKVGIRFSGEPVTQPTHQSCANMNHV